MSPATPAAPPLDPHKYGVRVRCTVCGREKGPVGRSYPMGVDLCADGCSGYYLLPHVGSLWPNESEADFGYPVSDRGTRSDRPAGPATPTPEGPELELRLDAEHLALLSNIVRRHRLASEAAPSVETITLDVIQEGLDRLILQTIRGKRASILASGPAVSPQPEPPQDEIAWVIEDALARMGQPCYWTGIGRQTFSTNHLKAVRFARKQDAECVAALLTIPANIVEHMWSASRLPMQDDRDATCAWDCALPFPHEGPCAASQPPAVPAAQEATPWDSCGHCHTLMWCSKAALCLSESNPDEHPNAFAAVPEQDALTTPKEQK